MKTTDKTAYTLWIERCASIALSSEWMIDAANPDWLTWFERGLTPAQAVDLLFAQIRADEKPQSPSDRGPAGAAAAELAGDNLYKPQPTPPSDRS